MKITFVLPELNLTGGVRVVGIYSQFLARRGHQVNVLYPSPKKKSLKKKLKAIINFLSDKHETLPVCPYFDHKMAMMYQLPFHEGVQHDLLPDADVVISTFWNTAEWVNTFPISKGNKVYFIQHYEVHPWLPVERVKRTFQFEFNKIAVSEWIAKCLLESEAVTVDAIVPNGVDLKQFNAEKREKQDVLTVGFMYSPRQYKGTHIAIEAINLARKFYPDLKVKTFAAEPAEPSLVLPDGTEFFLSPKQSEIKNIYSGCDVWLFTSLKEGFGLPILEAMACRTPVIATPAGAAVSLVNSENGVLMSEFNAQEVADAIVHFAKKSGEQWLRASEAALKTAQAHTWEQTSSQFEMELLRIINH